MPEREIPQEPLRFLENPQIRGVNGQLISDLKLVLNQFGERRSGDDPFFFYTGQLPDESELFISQDQSVEGSTVVIASNPNPKSLASIRTNHGRILWDRSLSSFKAKEIVSRLNAVARIPGFIERIKMEDVNPSTSWSFNETPPVEGVTPELISEIDDMVTNWGRLYPHDQTLGFREGWFVKVEGELSITKTINPQNPLALRVSKLDQAGLPLSFLTNHGLVMWVDNISAQEAKTAMRRINIAAAFVGLFDTKTGQRQPLPQDVSLGNIGSPQSIDAVFNEPRVSIPILPDQDPQQIMRLYDRPDELMIHETTFGDIKGLSIILKKELVYHQRREQITLELLQERNITPERMSELSHGDILELRAEIEARFSQAEAERRAILGEVEDFFNPKK